MKSKKRWKYGYHADRDTKAYQRWKLKVKEKYPVCVICGSSKSLNVHHILPWIKSKWNRYRVSNGVTLCELHHLLYHDEYSIDECNAKTLKLFIRKYKK